MNKRVLIWDDEHDDDPPLNIQKNDLVLIIGQKDDGIEWFKVVLKDQKVSNQIYSIGAGGLKYSPLIFAKYLQYGNEAQGIFYNNKKYTDKKKPQLNELFSLWEKFVNEFSKGKFCICKEFLEEIKELSEADPFFCKTKELVYFLDNYQKILSLNLMFNCFEDYSQSVRASISHPTRKNLSSRLSFLKVVNKNTKDLKLEKFSKTFSRFHSFLRELNQCNFERFLFLLSCYLYFLSDLYFRCNNFVLCVQLCHRSIDIYFEYLGKEKNIREITADYFLMDKYKKLVDEGIIRPDANIKDKINYLNRCRRYLVIAHGNWNVDRNTAKKILYDSRSIITEIEGPRSEWSKFSRLIEPLEINIIDIFSFEDPVEEFLQLEENLLNKGS